VRETSPEDPEIPAALRRLGKTQPEGELNCGGCGYDSCRRLAAALLDGRAEPNMCVSYMRKLAMNKANALIRSMPAGVVILDENLLVVECNRRFAETLGGETPMIFDAKPGMEGADIAKLAPEMRSHFAKGLESEVDALRKDVRIAGRVLRLTVFTVDPGRIVGGVLQDITEPAVQREQIIQKAQEVIRKNVTTVQQIAYPLGENAAETEMILNSLAGSIRSTPSPLGWGSAAEADFLRGILKERPVTSARQLARALVQRALSLDGHKAKDDISCGVIYLRKPREVLVLTGASVDRAMDKEMARIALAFEGRKVICGGTTAGILGRELGRPLEMDLRELDPDVPPVSTLEGFDLVTEGAITLAAVARMLDEQNAPELERPNAATRLAGVLLDGDIIHTVAGTKINEALQDPNLPQDLDIRRNLLRRLHRALTEKFLKDVKVRFI